MDDKRPPPSNIDDYIAGFSPDVRATLERIRATIRKAAPDAQEKISYRIPAFAQNGVLVYFAAFRHHIGFYPPVRGDAGLQKKIAKYGGPKGNLQFPLEQPIPYALIERIVKHRVKQNMAKATARKKAAGVTRQPVPTKADTAATAPYGGGCACGAVRYRLHRAPMFVHCCHCTRCQRETGGPFAHHAMIEFTQMSVQAGEVEFVKVPTDSGTTHWVARCPSCRTAMWNEHGSRSAITRYVRVGTLDVPARWPPLAHIYVESKQSWLVLPGDAPSFDKYYDAMKLWPKESLDRYAAAKSARAAGAAKTKASGAARKKRT